MGLVRSFQISAVFPHLTVLDNVRVALQRPDGTRYQFWRSDRGAATRLTPAPWNCSQRSALTDSATSPAVDLPYGRKRALEIATTLALDPE